MKYFGGCDVGSTYTKAVILDENGKMCADTTIRSKINAEQSAIAAMQGILPRALRPLPTFAAAVDLKGVESPEPLYEELERRKVQEKKKQRN